MNDAVANTTRYPLSLRPLAAAIMVGIPLAGLALVATQFSPVGRELFDRYLAHPLEHVELALFLLRTWRFHRQAVEPTR